MKSSNSLTPEMEEYVRCASDKAHFIFTHCKVNIPNLGITQMEDWLHQQQLIEIIDGTTRIIILKARQLGISWLMAGLALWYAIFVPGSNVGIFSRKENDASDILRNRIRVMHQHLPDYMQLPLGKDNDIELSFPANNSHIRAFPADADSGSSYTFNLVIMDEMAKMEYAEDLLTSILPTVENGTLICLSSARGMKNTFATTYWNARKSLNEFTPVFIPYHALKGRTKEWWKRTTANFPGWKALQEYPSTENEAFLTAGTCLFDVYKLKEMTPEAPMMGMYDTEIYRMYQEGHVYYVGVDTAVGLASGDFICAQIFDATDRMHVAKFRTRMPIEEFGDALYDLLYAYGSPKVIIEEQPLGRMVVKDLRARGYSNFNIYHRSPGRPCSHTGPTNRPALLEDLAVAVRTDQFTTVSEATLEEFKGFGWNDDKGRFEALSGNDDEVMAMALMYHLVTEAPKEFEPTPGTSYLGPSSPLGDVNWAASDPLKGRVVDICDACNGERIAYNTFTGILEACRVCNGMGKVVYAAH